MTLILVLASLALVLALVEIFIVPGFGLAGIGAILCTVADIALGYAECGLGRPPAPPVAATAILGLALLWLARSKAVDKMALHSTIDSTNATAEQLSVKVGDEGKALTRLALVGNALIAGKVVEVKSAGAFIDPETRVRVVRVSEANITVEPA